MRNTMTRGEIAEWKEWRKPKSGVERLMLLSTQQYEEKIDSLIAALEAAWGERDANVMELEVTISERNEAIVTMNNLCQQNTELLEDIVAMRIDRDTAIKEGLALTLKIQELEEQVMQLKRGEYICRKCGLRKDAEVASGADF